MAMDVKLDSHIFFLILTLSFFLTQSHCKEDSNYRKCKTTTYNCGSIKNISYPFWGNGRPRFCGSNDQFKLNCFNNHTTSIQVGHQNFSVISIDPLFYSMKLSQTHLSASCPNLTNTSLDPTLFLFDHYTTQNLTIFYNCPTGFVSGAKNVTCNKNINIYQKEELRFFYAKDDDGWNKNWPELVECGVHVQVPIQRGNSGLNKSLSDGFVVHYIADWSHCTACNFSGGICGTKIEDASRFSCYCQNGIGDFLCPAKKRPWDWKRKAIVGAAASSLGVIVTSIAFFLYLRRKKNGNAKSYVQSQSQSERKSRCVLSSDSYLKDVEKGSKYFGVHLFTYAELEEATNYFDAARELGDGGFGTVYYGKLKDGRAVAVKRLYDNNCKRFTQFKNEVEILTRLRHQNLVSLYGCTSRHSRELLLVYEYVPNGTVADHLHSEKSKKPHTLLPWHTRMNIAIETASALSYLHASDIIHRDVKTTNILLDNHFSVKVADFGLSRLFPNDVTHISTAPQGTPGYVDPEYHECYQLSNKSDVYSFGVVLIELISAMPAVDITRRRQDINLSNMAINKIQNGKLHEMVDPSLGFEGDYKARKMINGVAELAFQCLQSVKDMRPSMEELVERLMEIKNDDESKAEEMDIVEEIDDVVLLKHEPPPPSPDSNLKSTETTPNASG